jgi:hypothetical protein
LERRRYTSLAFWSLDRQLDEQLIDAEPQTATVMMLQPGSDVRLMLDESEPGLEQDATARLEDAA